MDLSALPIHDGREPLIEVYQMPSAELGFLVSVFEASEGVALVRTLDQSRGIIECWIMPDFADDFHLLLASMRRRFPIQPLGKDFD